MIGGLHAAAKAYLLDPTGLANRAVRGIANFVGQPGSWRASHGAVLLGLSTVADGAIVLAGEDPVAANSTAATLATIGSTAGFALDVWNVHRSGGSIPKRSLFLGVSQLLNNFFRWSRNLAVKKKIAKLGMPEESGFAASIVKQINRLFRSEESSTVPGEVVVGLLQTAVLFTGIAAGGVSKGNSASTALNYTILGSVVGSILGLVDDAGKKTLHPLMSGLAHLMSMLIVATRTPMVQDVFERMVGPVKDAVQAAQSESASASAVAV
ncbi:MAG: hypothetical protein ACKVPX_05260 [Myxococcaceae bacterium]